ncbi:MAG: HK97 family phage prohead protease [Thermomicrobiales bacterium]
MGDLQEYSWGFRVLDSDYAERDGQDVRVITKAEVYEVSPVLVGANRQTGTLALKRLLTEGHEPGLTFADESDAVLAAARRFAERAAALAATRAKDGRVLSAANVDRLQSHASALHQVADDLSALCAVAMPKAATVPREVVEALRMYSRQNGVPV